ncbi:MAG: tetratricopeptide repeat protein [Pseudomonadota bacterium]
MSRFAVALILALLPLAAPAQSLSALAEDEAEAEALLAELATAPLPTWESVENKILRIWSRSGSDTADLMLQRGQDLIEEEEFLTAVEHLTALTDHAPDFAEGWHARATAFFHLEEYGLAIEDIFRTLALNPHHFGALTGLGIMQEEMGQPERALLAFEKAQALNPHREQINQAIERLRIEIGRSTL